MKTMILCSLDFQSVPFSLKLDFQFQSIFLTVSVKKQLCELHQLMPVAGVQLFSAFFRPFVFSRGWALH